MNAAACERKNGKEDDFPYDEMAEFRPQLRKDRRVDFQTADVLKAFLLTSESFYVYSTHPENHHEHKSCNDQCLEMDCHEQTMETTGHTITKTSIGGQSIATILRTPSPSPAPPLFEGTSSRKNFKSRDNKDSKEGTIRHSPDQRQLSIWTYHPSQTELSHSDSITSLSSFSEDTSIKSVTVEGLLPQQCVTPNPKKKLHAPRTPPTMTATQRRDLTSPPVMQRVTNESFQRNPDERQSPTRSMQDLFSEGNAISKQWLSQPRQSIFRVDSLQTKKVASTSLNDMLHPQGGSIFQRIGPVQMQLYRLALPRSLIRLAHLQLTTHASNSGINCDQQAIVSDDRSDYERNEGFATTNPNSLLSHAAASVVQMVLAAVDHIWGRAAEGTSTDAFLTRESPRLPLPSNTVSPVLDPKQVTAHVVLSRRMSMASVLVNGTEEPLLLAEGDVLLHPRCGAVEGISSDMTGKRRLGLNFCEFSA